MAKALADGHRILFVCQHYWPESFRITDIANFFVGQGDEVEVLCGIPNYPKGNFYEGYSWRRRRRQLHDGVEIRRVFEIPRGNNSNLRILVNYLSFPLFSLFHVPRLLTRRYDRIFIYQLSPVMMAVAGILVGKLRRIETTMYVLDLWPENLFSVLRVRNRLLRWLLTAVSHWHYRNVDKLVVLSEQMRQALLSVSQLPPDRVIVLPQACEKLYEEDRSDVALSERFSGGFNVLYAGNISPAQSFNTMVEAAVKLRRDGYDDIRWIIVGDGMSRGAAERAVREAGMADAFVFEGQHPVEEIPAYSGVADVLVGCLVKSELLEATIPAKVLSYVASGKPIVLAMDGEVQTLVNDTIRCGFVGPTEDASVLAENIARVYGLDASERAQMGARAREYHFAHLERNIVLGKLRSFMLADVPRRAS